MCMCIHVRMLSTYPHWKTVDQDLKYPDWVVIVQLDYFVKCMFYYSNSVAFCI